MYSTRLPSRIVSPDGRHVLWSTNRPQRPLFGVPSSSTRSHAKNSVGHSTQHSDMAQDDGSDDDDQDLRYSGRDKNDPDPRDDEEDRDKKHRVIDFDVDDSDWEDMQDGITDGLGTTTHRSRNPHLPANSLRKRRHRVAGPNARASVARRREAGGKRLDALAEDLNTWEVEREERVHALAEKHGMKVLEVRRRMLALSTYGARRKVSTYNAKISRIMTELNADLGVGERYTIPEVKLMVAEDPSMLEGFTKAENKQMVKDILAKREKKARGMRTNNLAAAADAKRTMDRLMMEIINLAERVGMIGFAMFSRGHVHDKTLPVTIQSWGAMDFFREVLKRDPADVSHLFELWAVSCERGKAKKNKLLAMQQESTGIITTGLQTILGVTKCAMNYESYIEKLMRGKGVGLVNWPDGVDFKRMSLQSAIGPLQTLLDSLKCGIMRWKRLMAAEKEKLIAQYKEMVGNGEIAVKKKSRSRRSTKNAVIVEEDEGEEGEDEERHADNDEEEEEAPRARKPAAKGKRTTKSSNTGRKSSKAAGNDGDTEAPRTHKKPAKDKPAPRSGKRALKSAAQDDDSGTDENGSDDNKDALHTHEKAPPAAAVRAERKQRRRGGAARAQACCQAEDAPHEAKSPRKPSAKRTARPKACTVQEKL
ncbi:hypothetical protein K438DRAFT_2140505 [Mycena galopus ATCC 62051]|nr:hypothetical protein K438DRAFT_2140505 [Mycena galopus ATCC 62051]